jgi:hypothetical protein
MVQKIFIVTMHFIDIHSVTVYAMNESADCSFLEFIGYRWKIITRLWQSVLQRSFKRNTSE